VLRTIPLSHGRSVSLRVPQFASADPMPDFESSVSPTSAPPPAAPKFSVPLSHVFFATTENLHVRAVTDRGRRLPVFVYEALAMPVNGQQLSFRTQQESFDFLCWMEQQFLIGSKQDPAKVVRVRPPDTASNCHGWLFTGGQFGIPDAEVPAILADHGYAAVADAQEGDVAIYHCGDELTHSGLVRRSNGYGDVLIESKWGPFGVYLHAPAALPFRGACSFYRTTRRGHQLAISRPGS
jgi:hypothetical protein